MMADTDAQGNIIQQFKSDVVIFDNEEAVWDNVSYFQDCRQQGKFTDMVVQLKDALFPCHRIIVTARSPYFESYFSFLNDTDTKGTPHVVLDSLPVRGFTPLIDYMYSCQLEVNHEDALVVLHCADFLLMPEVVKWCAQLVLQHLDAANCVEAFLQANALNLQSLRESALAYIAAHLPAVSTAGDFHCLSTQHLAEALAWPGLSVHSNKDIINALCKWAMDEHGKLMMSHVDDLAEILVPLGIPFSEVLAELKNVPAFQEVLGGLFSSAHESLLTTKVVTTEVMIVVNSALSWSSSSNSSKEEPRKLYFYHAREEKWKVLTNLPYTARRYFSACVVNNKIYVTGGDGRPYDSAMPVCYRDVWEFDPVILQWRQKQDMLHGRYGHSTTAMHSKIFIIGGNQNGDTSIGEIYDPRTEQKNELSPIPGLLAIYNASVATLGGLVYVIGGLTVDMSMDHEEIGERNAVPTLEVFTYCPSKNFWIRLTSLQDILQMKNLSIGIANVVAEQGLLIFSGENSNAPYLIFNPLTRNIHQLMSSQGHHYNSGTLMMGGRLYCLCGRESIGHMQDIVHYVDLQDSSCTWKPLGLIPGDLKCAPPICLKAFACLNDL